MNNLDTDYVSMPSAEAQAKDMGLRNFLLGIYQKMALGLLVTGALAWAVANSPALVNLLFVVRGVGADGLPQVGGYKILGYVFAFAPLALSFISGVFMNELNAAKAGAFYWLFVAILGVSLSAIFLRFTGMSIATVFFITAATFGAVSLIGYTTKVNMSGWGGFLYAAVIGMILAGVVNIFLGSPILHMAMSAIGVLLFSALIAFQTQQLKMMYYSTGQMAQGHMAALTYIGALGLYINFINLFTSLISLFGDRR